MHVTKERRARSGPTETVGNGRAFGIANLAPASILRRIPELNWGEKARVVSFRRNCEVFVRKCGKRSVELTAQLWARPSLTESRKSLPDGIPRSIPFFLSFFFLLNPAQSKEI